MTDVANCPRPWKVQRLTSLSPLRGLFIFLPNRRHPGPKGREDHMPGPLSLDEGREQGFCCHRRNHSPPINCDSQPRPQGETQGQCEATLSQFRWLLLICHPLFTPAAAAACCGQSITADIVLTISLIALYCILICFQFSSISTLHSHPPTPFCSSNG